MLFSLFPLSISTSSIVKKGGRREHVYIYGDHGRCYFFISLGLIPKYFLNILLKCSGDSYPTRSEISYLRKSVCWISFLLSSMRSLITNSHRLMPLFFL